VRIKNSSVKSSYEASFILPKKPTNLLKSLLTKNTDIVLIEFDENNAYFKTNNFEMVCRLIEGRYPNYDAVIPLDNPYRTVIDRLSLLTGLKMVSHFASESSHIVKMEFSENMLKISAQDLDFSTSAEEDLQCQYDGINLSIGFKASYIIDILNNISSENVVLQLADTTRGGVIVPSENLENEDLLMLTMPLQIND
jgi:DNA polymerase-3 subunit beta